MTHEETIEVVKCGLCSSEIRKGGQIEDWYVVDPWGVNYCIDCGFICQRCGYEGLDAHGGNICDDCLDEEDEKFA